MDVEWHFGSTHNSSRRGPWFDSHPDPDGFIGSVISLLLDNVLINNFIDLIIIISFIHFSSTLQFISTSQKNLITFKK